MNEVYYFKKLTIVFSHEKYNTIKNLYQIVLNNETTIKKFTGEINFEYKIQRKFTEIKDIPRKNENDIIRNKKNFLNIISYSI